MRERERERALIGISVFFIGSDLLSVPLAKV